MIRLPLSVASLGLSALLLAACGDPNVVPSTWEQALEELREFTNEVNEEDDVSSIATIGAEFQALAAVIDGGKTPEETLTATTCAALSEKYGPESAESLRARIDTHLENFAKASLLGVLAGIPSASDLNEALTLQDPESLGTQLGLSADEVIALQIRLENDLNLLLDQIASDGLSRSNPARESFEADGIGARARGLLAHEAAHVIQQRSDGSIAEDIQQALDRLKALELADLEVQEALLAYEGSIASILVWVEDQLSDTQTCAALSSSQVWLLTDVLFMSAIRFETLNTAASARNEIALEELLGL